MPQAIFSAPPAPAPAAPASGCGGGNTAADPDAREALRGGVRGVVEMYAAHRDVLRDLSIEKTATTLITTADRSLCR